MVQMEDQQHVEESDSILVRERSDLPEGIAKWILEEPSDVLEGSPSLGHISWFLGLIDKLGQITIGFLG